jgi:hypothetical protein
MRTIYDMTTATPLSAYNTPLTRFIIVMLVLALAAISTYARKKQRAVTAADSSRSSLPAPWSYLVAGVLFGFYTYDQYRLGQTDRRLTSELRRAQALHAAGKSQIIEGCVQVLRTQPTTGHAPGDLLEINGQRLAVNYFVAGYGYHATIAHGGALKPDTYARITLAPEAEVAGPMILRVEIDPTHPCP